MAIKISPSPIVKALGALFIVLLAAGHAAVQAQSAYALTVLKAPNSKPLMPKAIDAQNNVLGSARYLSGYGLLPRYGSSQPLFPIFGWLYSFFPVRWSDSTAASVSPRKLAGSQLGILDAVSADGNTFEMDAVFDVYNATSGKKTGTFNPPTLAGIGATLVRPKVVGVANDGTMVMNYLTASVYEDEHGYSRVGLWTKINDGQELPLGAYVGATAVSVNGLSQVAGVVYEQGAPNQRAAIWINGALTVIDHAPGRGSAALAVNQAGQVLMRVNPLTVISKTVNDVDGNPALMTYLIYSAPSYSVSLNGVETPITAIDGLTAVVPSAINASGVVVGRMGVAGGQDGVYLGNTPLLPNASNALPGRAFIWKSGVTTDLTTLVASKGAKLPNGAVLVDAIAINDQGSILAEMRASDGTLSFVRLTAKR